jgi:hypothetical protein
MRGLVGDRLLKRFFSSVVRRPDFDPAQELGPKSDDGEETTMELSDPKPEKAQSNHESEDIENTNAVTSLSDS